MGSFEDVSPDPVIARNPVGSLLEAGFGPDGLATASFDRDRKYRYRLSRVWDESLPRIVWCLLNPSTASASVSDRTLVRTISFTRSWGGGALEIVNLFAWRTPYASELAIQDIDLVGPGNNEAILEAVSTATSAIAAWGNLGRRRNPQTGVPRGIEVRDLLSCHRIRLNYLRLTEQGQPGHPLYIPKDVTPTAWS